MTNAAAKSAHTKGPWSHDGRTIWGPLHGGKLAPILRVPSTGVRRPSEHDANLQLAVAAPEMVAALRLAKQVVRSDAVAYVEKDDGSFRQVLAHDEICAALSKAEGR